MDTSVKAGANITNNFQLLCKLISQAADAHAGDTYFYLQYYLHLKDLTPAEDRRVSAGPSVLIFTSVAIAQIVALFEASDLVFKLSALRHLYGTLVAEVVARSR